MVMASLAASRREAEDPGTAGSAEAGIEQVLAALAAAAAEVRATASGSGFLLGQALLRLTEATSAVEELAQRQVAVRLVAEMASVRGPRLRVIR